LNEAADRPAFPFVGLVVSGGHTVLYYCEDFDKLDFLGQTQDDAVGEAYDKVAKILGLGYPGGPAIEKAAKLSRTRDPIKFPKSYLGKDSLDFSFSGIKTAVLYYVRNMLSSGARPVISDDSVVSEICFAFQEAVLDVLVDKALLAANKRGVKRIVVGGGVAANGRLREKFRERSGMPEGIRTYFPSMAYCVDNAAMIGLLGEALYLRGHRSAMSLTAQANLEV
jgi:N6-L-threonylcarbamoyladenine synthase